MPCTSHDGDATKVVAKLDMPRVIAYGKEKGVGIWVYVNQHALMKAQNFRRRKAGGDICGINIHVSRKILLRNIVHDIAAVNPEKPECPEEKHEQYPGEQSLSKTHEETDHCVSKQIG